MEKDRGELTESILSLTLRIIYLLTGGEYVVEKKTGGRKTSRSEIFSKTRRKRNHQEILEITKKIIELLTGEVPIRCQDVTVHLSMEEWEYLEGHKDLYQDVMTENLRLLTSPGHKDIEEISEDEDPPDSSPQSSHLPFAAERSKRDTSPNTALNDLHEESISGEESEDLSGSDLYKPAGRTQQNSWKMEAIEGNEEEEIIDVDIYIPVDNSMPSPSTSITGKLVPSDDPTEEDIDIITIPDHSPARSGASDESDWSDNEQVTYRDVSGRPKNSVTSLYHRSYSSTVQRSRSRDKKYNGSLHERPYRRVLEREVDHADSPSFICSECGKCLPSQSDLVIHQESHFTAANKYPEGNRKKSYPRNPVPRPNLGGEEGYKCRICGLCFSNAMELVTHHQSHIKKPYSCTICGRGFYSRSGLVTHQKTHALKRLYDCPTCGKTFISNAHLLLHQEVHGDAGDSSGTGADAGDSSGGGSNLNDYQHFGNQDKLFSCSICGECFYSSDQFLQHQKSHFKSDPLMCPDCGKIFMRKSGLAKHKRVVHQGHIALSCAVCGKGFACRSELARHMTVHSGQKPYACTECGKCFSFKSALVRHQRIHTGDRLQYCPDCGKGFSCNSELLRHQSVHQ